MSWRAPHVQTASRNAYVLSQSLQGRRNTAHLLEFFPATLWPLWKCLNLWFSRNFSTSQCVNSQCLGHFCLWAVWSKSTVHIVTYRSSLSFHLTTTWVALSLRGLPSRSYLLLFLNPRHFSSPSWSVDSRTGHKSSARYVSPALFVEEIWSLYSVSSVYTPSDYPAITHWAHSAIALYQRSYSVIHHKLDFLSCCFLINRLHHTRVTWFLSPTGV